MQYTTKMETDFPQLTPTSSIINDAVLMPTYNSPKDEIARGQLQKAFPDREIIGIDCLGVDKTTRLAALCHNAHGSLPQPLQRRGVWWARFEKFIKFLEH